MQPWQTPFPIWNQTVVVTVAFWPTYRFLKRQAKWSGIPISWRIFQFVMIHTIKGFGVVNKAEVDVFLELFRFFYDPTDVGNLIFDSSEVKWNEVAQLCLTLCDPMDGSLPGSTVHGIFQARILEWAAISFSSRPSQPRDRTRVSCIACRLFTFWTTKVKWKSLSRVQLFVTPWTIQSMDFLVSHIAGEFFTSWATREAREASNLR